jgi:hypothetical protein
MSIEPDNPGQLVYPNISAGLSGCNQLLLIDSAIQEPSVMANAVNSSTFPVTYGWSSTKADLIALLREKFTTIDRIAIAFSCQKGSPQPFLDNQVFFTETETTPYSENVTFLISVINEFQVKQIDYLGCSTLKYAIWNNYYSILKETGVTVGASNDQTGNIKYGGNWTLESTGQDIDSVYFTQGIRYYQYVLDSYYTTLTHTVTRSKGFYVYGNILYYYTGSSATGIASISAITGASLNPSIIAAQVMVIYILFPYIYYVTNANTLFRVNMDGTGNVTYVNNATPPSPKFLLPYGNDFFCIGSTGTPFPCVMHKMDKLGNVLISNVINGYNTVNSADISGSFMYIFFNGANGTTTGNMYQFNITGATATLVSSNFLGTTLTGTPILKIYNNYIYVTSILSGSAYKLSKYNLSNGSLVDPSVGAFTQAIANIDIYETKMYLSSNSTAIYVYDLDKVVCFKEDSLILTDQGYVPVQDLRKGDLVRTFKHGFVPVYMIVKKEIYHPASQERIKDQLYQCSTENYPDLFEPLVITGCHSILVKKFVDDAQKQKTDEVLNGIYVTDKHYRLPACVDERATVYDKPGNHTIYHFALENDDYLMNYGIYANGLLVETSSKRYLSELANMKLVE